MGLPLTVPPNQTLALIVVRPNRDIKRVTVVNNKTQPYLWPTREPIFPPEYMAKIYITNHGDIAAFNISGSIKLHIGVRGTSGIKIVPLELPLVHGLKPGDRSVIYIVNQSSYPVMTELEEDALMQVQGEKERRRIVVQRREIQFFDQVPILPQSQHEWEGDKIIKPDARRP